MESIINSIRKRRPGLTFYKNGRIDIAANVSKDLELSEDCAIDILHDNGEYYLRKTAVQKYIQPSLKCMRVGKKSCSFRTFSVELCKCMYNIADVKTTTEKFALPTGSPINNRKYGVLIPIITRIVL